MVNALLSQLFWNVLQVWMTGKDVYLQMTWSWPDKTWNILCSYCLQWNTSQSKFRNHYFLFLFAFSILSQLFLIWGCIYCIYSMCVCVCTIYTVLSCTFQDTFKVKSPVIGANSDQKQMNVNLGMFYSVVVAYHGILVMKCLVSGIL